MNSRTQKRTEAITDEVTNLMWYGTGYKLSDKRDEHC